MIKSRAKPKKAVRTLLGLFSVVFAMIVVAQLSGSGWVQNVAFSFGGLLLMVIVAPYFSIKNTKLNIVSAPLDVLVDEICVIKVTSSNAVIASSSKKLKDYMIFDSVVGDLSDIRIKFLKKGCYDSILITVKSASPFGLIWWEKTLQVPVGHVIYVGPRIGKDFIATEVGANQGDFTVALTASSGLTKGVRDYVKGDSLINVHWRATAHSGKLMVREKEKEVGKAYQIYIAPASPDKSYEDALFSVSKLLAGENVVILTTFEDGGEVSHVIRSLPQAIRQLARAL